ncbi:hypothetical protein VNI00_010210 [Paramarasmius palmivorus]|uniref:F-box domain-containing protein n=1 Tax=Paramarasmius palmivorus TaxID=297713 RepID=A0AAW0CL17_9AGAR
MIPPELVYQVLNFTDRKYLLVPCSLVCWTWLEVSRTLYFNRLELQRKSRHLRRLEEIMRPSIRCTIPWKRIKTLSITKHSASPLFQSEHHVQTVCRTIGLLRQHVSPDVLVINVERSQPTIHTSHIISSAFDAISYLRLQVQEGDLNELVPFICMFPVLETVDLSCGTARDFTVSSPAILPTTLRDFRLRISRFTNGTGDTFAFWLKSNSAILAWKHLSLLDIPRTSVYAAALSPPYGYPSIETLYVSFKCLDGYRAYQSNVEDLIPCISLAHARCLREVTFYIPDTNYYLIPILKNVGKASRSVQHGSPLTIALITSDEVFQREPKEWLNLDQMVAENRDWVLILMNG